MPLELEGIGEYARWISNDKRYDSIWSELARGGAADRRCMPIAGSLRMGTLKGGRADLAGQSPDESRA
jgi:hypothetical protein